MFVCCALQRDSITTNSLSQQLDDVLDSLGYVDGYSTTSRNIWPSTSETASLASTAPPHVPSSEHLTRIIPTGANDNVGEGKGKEFRIYVESNGTSEGPSPSPSMIESDPSLSSRGSTVKKLGDNNIRERVKQNLLNAAMQAKSVLKTTPNVPNDFIFKDYLPHLFLQIRQICKINPTEYAESFKNVTKEKFSEGRSGAFLYFSADQKYIVKTTTQSENEVLLTILQDYVDYLQTNPRSLLVKFLGAHSLTMYNRKIHFVVMLNVFSKANLSERYDLKGSWVHRHGDNFQLQRKKKSSKFVPLYKDNDLQHKIILNPQVANLLYDQILRDSAFLSGNKYFIIYM
jgi:hypothetical protein